MWENIDMLALESWNNICSTNKPQGISFTRSISTTSTECGQQSWRACWKISFPSLPLFDLMWLEPFWLSSYLDLFLALSFPCTFIHTCIIHSSMVTVLLSIAISSTVPMLYPNVTQQQSPLYSWVQQPSSRSVKSASILL